VSAAAREIYLRSSYLNNATVETIYFGGGTPSVLNYNQFKTLLDAIFLNYKVSDEAEITFEANPDDLTDTFFSSHSPLPFNRISMGIQSFDDRDLKKINRRHTGNQAIEAVRRAQKYGFNNISVDLIYGLPGQSVDDWQKQLNQVFGLDVQHISVYGLTYEKNTRLWKQREKGEVTATDDEAMITMYEKLVANMQHNGYEAYEISNFAKPGYRSRHNSAYWKMKPYLGIGPSAHSFDGKSRQWNIASNTGYIKAMQENEIFYELEELSANDRYNDYVMVSLRTSDGIDLEYLQQNFDNKYITYLLKSIEKYIDGKKIKKEQNRINFTSEGIHVSNMIISDLMYVD
jgi:oxygen-independent coproporphyrinogen-3 oxidase